MGDEVDGDPMTWERIHDEHRMAMDEIREAHRSVTDQLDAHMQWLTEAFAAMGYPDV